MSIYENQTSDDTTQNLVQELREFGVTTSSVKEAQDRLTTNRLSKHRNYHITAIRENAKLFIDKHDGVVMFSGRAVLNALQEIGAGKTATGGKMEGANAIADALGKHGLNLPMVFIKGKRRYSLSHIEDSVEDKAAAQARLDTLTRKEKAVIPVV